MSQDHKEKRKEEGESKRKEQERKKKKKGRGKKEKEKVKKKQPAKVDSGIFLNFAHLNTGSNTQYFAGTELQRESRQQVWSEKIDEILREFRPSMSCEARDCHFCPDFFGEN